MNTGKLRSIYKLFIFSAALACPLLSSGQHQYPTADLEPFYDLNFTVAERDSLYPGLENLRESIVAIHRYKLDNRVSMSLLFDPLPRGLSIDPVQKPIDWSLTSDVELPARKEELAFYPVYKLAALIKARKITSEELTRLYLDRLRTYGDTLECVISILEERAMEQARQADRDIAGGKYKGPLHGIPYGIKDLLAVEGTRTTWGAEPFREQELDYTATVVRKLDSAGAVLLAKFTMGALAMGDIWYGGVTRNPWNLKQGSSGSSAGSASATVAGLVAFSLGTETLGSIVSPSTRCGASGLRPTFGTVSRHGAMALSWSMDKIGPICRSALDCALVFDAIRGRDGIDRNVQQAAFNYAPGTDVTRLRVGYLKSAFDDDYSSKMNDNQTLEVLKSLGVTLVPVDLPEEIPVEAVLIMLRAEAAAAFDDLTRSDRDSLLSNQRRWAWPNSFRTARFIPAVEYINASRIRTELIEQYHSITKDFDVIVTPSFGGSQLLTTNLTGHPCVVVPNGFNKNGTPTSISFLGKLFGEAAVIALAQAYQEATEWDDKHPEMFR